MISSLVAASVLAPVASRTFSMGFTRWPSDLTIDAVQECQRFVEQNGDIVSVMFIGGMPWPEALAGKGYSADVQSNLAYRPPAGKKLFVSVTPLSEDRGTLAQYWGEKDNQPLPDAWKSKAFDDPDVKKAFTKWALDVVDRMQPDYLAIAIEANVLLSKDKEKWAKFKGLYRDSYAAVKAKHPNLPVFFTTDMNHYLKVMDEAKNTDQEGEVDDLMKSSDLFAMSLYPFMSADNGTAFDARSLDFAKKFKKPIAISESGMSSTPIHLPSFNFTMHGSAPDQDWFLEKVFGVANRDSYQFVINFASTDFDPLVKKLPPPVNEIASIWMHTGIRNADGTPKPAKKVWDKWFQMGK